MDRGRYWDTGDNVGVGGEGGVNGHAAQDGGRRHQREKLMLFFFPLIKKRMLRRVLQQREAAGKICISRLMRSAHEWPAIYYKQQSAGRKKMRKIQWIFEKTGENDHEQLPANATFIHS